MERQSHAPIQTLTHPEHLGALSVCSFNQSRARLTGSTRNSKSKGNKLPPVRHAEPGGPVKPAVRRRLQSPSFFGRESPSGPIQTRQSAAAAHALLQIHGSILSDAAVRFAASRRAPIQIFPFVPEIFQWSRALQFRQPGAPHCFDGFNGDLLPFLALVFRLSPSRCVTTCSVSSGTMRCAPSSTDFWMMDSMILPLGNAWSSVIWQGGGRNGILFVTRNSTRSCE